MAAPIADALILTFTERTALADWARAGVLERELALYRRLEAQVGRVVFVTWGQDEEDRLIGARAWPGLRILTHTGDAGSAEAGERLAREAQELLPEGARVVVKTNQFPGGELAVNLTRALRRAGHETALIARGGYPWSRFEALQHGPGSAQAALAGQREGALAWAADLLVGTTRAMIDDLCWRHGLPADRAALVPNFVMDDAAPTPGEIRDERTVLFAGRLVEQKRVDRLIDGAAIARGGVRLLIVGDGPLGPALRARALARGVDAEFRPRVAHDELLGLMRRCAAYAQPSDYEGHPKTVLEAMACGCAVLVTRGPGLSDAVDDGRTGVVVEPEPGVIARALDALLEDPARRAALGAAASASVRQECSLRRVGELEVEAYERALASARGGARGRDSRPPSQVQWRPDLLDAGVARAVGEWTRSVRGFARRLPARTRAEFLMALDSALYDDQGQAAVEASGGLHPKHRLMDYHAFFVERVRRGERVIDLGSGHGAVACSMGSRSGAEVVGVEINPENIRSARARAERAGLVGRVSFIAGDITRDRVPGRFDAVVLSNVLEHVPDRAALLRRWSEWYAPARFLIRVPAFDRDWRTPWKRELGVEWRLDPTHETEYTLASLEREAGDAGLVLDERIANWGEYWVVARPRAASEAAA